MKGRRICIVLVSMLMIGSICASAMNINYEKNNDESFIQTSAEDIELPVWNEGNSWTYDVEINGGFGSEMDFDLSITGLKFTVEQVLDDKYKVDVLVPRGGITGSATVSIEIAGIPININGDIANTKLEGTLYYDKTTLGILENIDDTDPTYTIHLDGIIDRPVIDLDFDIDMEFYVNNIFSCLSFPLNTGNSWQVDRTSFYFNYDVNIENIIEIEDQFASFYVPSKDVGEINYNCVRVEPKNGYDEAYKVTGNQGTKNEIWFAEKAGNIVYVNNQNIKLYVYEDEDDPTDKIYYTLESMTMELTETTYEPPNELPDKPNKPTGPTSGRAGPKYTYCASGGDDPDDHQVKYGFDWNGDGSVDSWTDLVDSGEQACIDHSFSSGGTYYIKAKTKDEKGGESLEWSTELTVTMAPNNAPDKPDIPTGETNGIVGNSYTYTTSTETDPDGDDVLYQFNWGDGEKSNWKENPSASHKWTSKGAFAVKARSKDQYGATSDWTAELSVNMQNTAPIKPDPPVGPAEVGKEKSITYTATTTDPEGHKILYKFDWGDGSDSGWVGPFDSNTEGSATHKWDSKGNYEIKVRAKDEYGEITDWSEPISINVPRSRSVEKPIFFNFLARFFEKYPNLFSALQIFFNQ
jgi:hypothetical protein